MRSMLTRSCAAFRLVSRRLCAATVRQLGHQFLSGIDGFITDLVNDTYACDNNKTLNDILKREFGFQGYVMSDWSAQHDTMSAVAGLDVSVT